jgi:hypothetical protein
MENRGLSRNILEALSSVDLISLADRYGIDVPEDLNRRFIISELLDISAELEEDDSSGLIITQDDPGLSELPLTYNETKISAVLSNPVWLYVFWDISAAEKLLFAEGKTQASLIVRVAVIGKDGTVQHKESFDVPVAITDTDQNILLPSGEKNIRVELILETATEKPRLLAVSGLLPLTRSCPDFRESIMDTASPLFELSSFKELMRTHFLQHRQAFS